MGCALRSNAKRHARKSFMVLVRHVAAAPTLAASARRRASLAAGRRPGAPRAIAKRDRARTGRPGTRASRSRPMPTARPGEPAPVQVQRRTSAGAGRTPPANALPLQGSGGAFATNLLPYQRVVAL